MIFFWIASRRNKAVRFLIALKGVIEIRVNWPSDANEDTDADSHEDVA
jgi:hypothetical protein